MQKKYSRAKLVQYIVDSLQDGANEAALAQSVAAYLIDAGKTSDLDSVMRDAQDLRARQNGVVELEARSAHVIEAAQVKQIEAVAKHRYPGAKKVTLNTVDDDTVVGGASLSFADASFDVTVRSKLNRLRETIS